jgi:hypothetical protein
VGIIGVALPFVLVLGKWIFESGGIQPSISDYYYTVMRNVFVGSLCAIGVFLMSYRGYEKKDDIAGIIACLSIIGVAFFPTTPNGIPVPTDQIIGIVHYICALIFFSTMAYFCLVLFRKSNPSKAMTPQKLQRNLVYKVCGGIIVACIALIASYSFFLRGTVIDRLDPVFWLESVAIVVFGFSWLTKGEAILKDIG